MTTKTLKELAEHGDFKIDTNSVTQTPDDAKKKSSKKDESKEAQMHRSGIVKYLDMNVNLGLRDTVGFGAEDMKSRDILKQTVLEVASDFEKVRGCIFVHKCERYRSGGADDVREMKKAMKTLGLDFNKHLLLVITHTAHLNDTVRDEYSEKIRKKISASIPQDKVVHVNFANLGEMNDDYRDLYKKAIKTEYTKMLDKLLTMMHEVSPASKEWKAHMSKILTETKGEEEEEQMEEEEQEEEQESHSVSGSGKAGVSGSGKAGGRKCMINKSSKN